MDPRRRFIAVAATAAILLVGAAAVAATGAVRVLPASSDLPRVVSDRLVSTPTLAYLAARSPEALALRARTGAAKVSSRRGVSFEPAPASAPAGSAARARADRASSPARLPGQPADTSRADEHRSSDARSRSSAPHDGDVEVVRPPVREGTNSD